MKVLVTGASGYVGRQLADRLSQSGHEVVCMVRKRSSLPCGKYTRITEADALHPETLAEALAEVHVAYYLIHSMSGRETGFDRLDREAAYNFAAAAKKAGVRRVIYLGGLAAGANVSPHLKSRHNTGGCCANTVPHSLSFAPASSLEMGVFRSKSSDV